MIGLDNVWLSLKGDRVYFTVKSN